MLIAVLSPRNNVQG